MNCAILLLAAWNVFWFDARGVWSPESASLPARFEFKNYDTYSRNYMAGCVTTTNSQHTGDLRGKTIVLHVTLETNGSPDFVFGGQVTGWNTGPIPPSFRVFLCGNSRPFRVAESNVDQLNYWWSSQGTSLDALAGGTALITIEISKLLWTAAHGQRSDAVEFGEFLSRVKQVGIMFGGGSFYDVGVALTPGTGAATFTLDSFMVIDPPQAPTKQRSHPYLQ